MRHPVVSINDDVVFDKCFLCLCRKNRVSTNILSFGDVVYGWPLGHFLRLFLKPNSIFIATTTESKTSEVDVSPNKTPTSEVLDSIVPLEEEPQNTFKPVTVVSTILNKPSDLKASVSNDESQMNVKDLEPLKDSQTSTESQIKEKIQTVKELEPVTSYSETVENTSDQLDQDFNEDLRNIEPETSETLENISTDQLDQDYVDLKNLESTFDDLDDQLDQDYVDLKTLESTFDDQFDHDQDYVDLKTLESTFDDQLDQDHVDLESTSSDQLDENPNEEWKENTSTDQIGMVSHKISIIKNFGHKHF